MSTKYLITFAALLTVTTVVACSQTAKPIPTVASTRPMVVNKERSQGEQIVPGSYIVNAPGDGAVAIRRVFAKYGVVQVNALGNNQYEMRLERDPGLDALNSLATGSNGAVTAIQPNIVYHAY
ncbi:MAG: hypothetical protein PHQ60_05010 [Sideroxydans sp.]|nr:hypothetical protein [Sideroxydans sp.]